MRASRAEAAAAATLLLLLATSAVAQTGAPVQLVPVPAQAPAPANAPPAPQAPSTAPSSDDDIHSAPLAPMDPSWVGPLGPADGALPREMWGVTPRTVVSAALPLLRPTTSPALQDLSRRLLLSDAIAPAGQDAADRPSLPELRLDRLLALGRLDGAALIDVRPQANASETFDRDGVELRFAANDIDGACKLVQQRASRYRNPWWDRAIIACQALTGALDQAALGLSAMRERKIAGDLAFEALIDTVDGQRQKLDKLPDPTPMRMALLAAAKLPLPADTLASAGPAALAVWATSDKVSVLQRLAAGERAQALGALPPDALGLLYASVDAKPEEQQAALKSGKLPDDARGRAILYGVARNNNTPATRIAALTPLLADARRRGAFVNMAQLVAPLVAELRATPEAQGFAGDAARVLLATGQSDQAAPWIELANAPELRLIAALARPIDEDKSPALQEKEAVGALTARDPRLAVHQTDLLVALLWALWEPRAHFDTPLLLEPLHQGMMPNMALWLDQQQAAAAGRIGETVLTSLIMATAGDQLTPEPLLLANVVSALKAVGLEAEARALAVEAALAAGI